MFSFMLRYRTPADNRTLPYIIPMRFCALIVGRGSRTRPGVVWPSLEASMRCMRYLCLPPARRVGRQAWRQGLLRLFFAGRSDPRGDRNRPRLRRPVPWCGSAGPGRRRSVPHHMDLRRGPLIRGKRDPLYETIKVTASLTRHSVTLALLTTTLVSFTQAPSMPLTVSDALAIPLRIAVLDAGGRAGNDFDCLGDGHGNSPLKRWLSHTQLRRPQRRRKLPVAPISWPRR